MKKISFLLLTALIATPALANYDDEEYDSYDDESYTTYETPKKTDNRDTYAGFRIHRNEHITLSYDRNAGKTTTIRDNNFGFGALVGNRLTDYVKLEFETMYTGISKTKDATDFDYDIWSNMLNVNLYKNYGGAVEPYIGIGIGLTGMWGDVAHEHDSEFDLSFALMAGVNFALNRYVDLNLGLRYVDYGEIEYKGGTAAIYATEIYIGGAYKFSIF